MRLGLIADTHDRVPAIAALVAEFQAREVALVLHAGDYCSPFSLAPLHALTVPVIGVFGRNDGDRPGLTAAAAQGLATELFESPHSLEVGGRRDAPGARRRRGGGAVASPRTSSWCTAASTAAEMKMRGEALMVCPGEGCGWVNGYPGAAILDLDTNEVEFLKSSGPEWKS